MSRCRRKKMFQDDSSVESKNNVLFSSDTDELLTDSGSSYNQNGSEKDSSD